jgi:hypothetical protein
MTADGRTDEEISSRMAAGVVFMQRECYAGGEDGPPFFAEEPVKFSSRQERLHWLGEVTSK